MIKIKRLYDPISHDDGFRILVERLWPRGFTKEKAGIDCWAKIIAPSAALRKWFDHDIEKWNDFKSKYQLEILKNTIEIDNIKMKFSAKNITLVYSAADTKHNSAVVLLPFFT